MLHGCARHYYLRYYLAWNGWESEASSATRLAYALSKMTDLPSLVGEVVHDLIASHLRTLEAPVEITLDPQEALRRMRGVWADARQHWAMGAESRVASPKRHRPVAEIFYGEENRDPDRLRVLANRAPECIEAFLRSGLLSRLREAPREDLLWLDPAGGSFDERTVLEIDGIPVHCVPDLVWRTDGDVEVVDWKTGVPTVSDGDQIAAYGLWAVGKLGADPERLRGRLVYLAEGTREEPVPVDREALETAAATIRSDLQEMADLLARPEENLPLPMDRFRRRDEPAVCGRCHYRVFCWPDGVPAPPR
jgi:hypothetical protein